MRMVTKEMLDGADMFRKCMKDKLGDTGLWRTMDEIFNDMQADCDELMSAHEKEIDNEFKKMYPNFKRKEEKY